MFSNDSAVMLVDEPLVVMLHDPTSKDLLYNITYIWYNKCIIATNYFCKYICSKM